MIELAIGVLIGAVIPTAGWFVEHRLQTARAAEQRLHDARKVLYQEILTPYTKLFQAIGARPANATGLARETQLYLASADHRIRINELMMVGSDDVVRAFNRLVRFQSEVRARKLTERPGDVLWLWADLLLAVRKDIGLPKTKLTATTMIEGWVHDMETVFPDYDSELVSHMATRPIARQEAAREQ